MIRQARLAALVLLVKTGRVKLDQIEDTEYRQAVEEALLENSEE